MATARRPNILRLCLVIVLVLCIGIGVWQGVLFIQSQGQPAASVSGGTMVALPFSSDTPYEPFGEGFVYLSDQGLHCIDPAGQELWQQTIADLAGLSVSQSAIVCYRGNTAMLLGADGALLSQVDCTDPIAFARIGRGRIAACTQPDGAARLVIADYAGNILDTLDYGAGELMDCGFDGQDNLWTLTMASSDVYKRQAPHPVHALLDQRGHLIHIQIDLGHLLQGHLGQGLKQFRQLGAGPLRRLRR